MATNPWGNDPHHMSAVRLVFSFLHGFTVHNLASSAYVSIFPYDHFIRFVAHVAARALRNVSLFLHHLSDMQTYDERAASLLADVLE